MFPTYLRPTTSPDAASATHSKFSSLPINLDPIRDHHDDLRETLLSLRPRGTPTGPRNRSGTTTRRVARRDVQRDGNLAIRNHAQREKESNLEAFKLRAAVACTLMVWARTTPSSVYNWPVCYIQPCCWHRCAFYDQASQIPPPPASTMSARDGSYLCCPCHLPGSRVSNDPEEVVRSRQKSV
ncbi:hypothetical protein B0H10DRAFT_1947988 [Mycena sp. CBHHK59/15]|nr:hypothetical protein B0H10DRAFT_1947988 [Mycena sp. CBHHK59/15]